MSKRFKKKGKNWSIDVTPYILKYFDEVALAILFMDDGCKETFNGKIKTFKISIGGFTLDEVNLLAKHIEKKFDLNTKVYLEQKKYPCIKFTKKENKEKFVKIIRPYLHPSMLYKIQ